MERQLVFELPNDVRRIEDTVEFVVSRCMVCREVAHKLHLNFRVSLTEALSNAMIYGNRHDPAKRVRVEIFVRAGSVTAQVSDEGTGFDPDEVPDPTVAVNRRRTHGRGLFLMRELMDEVRFNDSGNSVTLVLHLPETEPDSGGTPV